ncbi:MAG: rubrerythrin family protein [Nitrospirae bacterium]|nr:rubrerythrin family protein [Nitrospirota bacterium]
MDNEISKLLDESIEMELNVSKLYNLYSNNFSEDRDFWWTLSIEEKNHAALVESGKKYLEFGIFPDEAVYHDLERLVESNREIKGLIENYEKRLPLMEEAYRTALRLEESSGESHFQKIMEKDSDSKIIKIFQDLNKGNKDHAQRIRKKMLERGIK